MGIVTKFFLRKFDFSVSQLRIRWRRREYLSLITHVLAFTAGCLLVAYFWQIACFIRVNGIGEMLLKFAPVGGPIVGITVFWWQVSRARYNQRIDLILKLAERFDKPEMRTFRAKAAKSLLVRPGNDDIAVQEVCNFFEDVGFLLVDRAIDDEAVYEFLSHWAFGYFHPTQSFRKTCNDGEGPKDLYSKYSRLFDVMSDYVVSKGWERPSYTKEQMNFFLSEESNLLVESETSTIENSRRFKRTAIRRR